MTAGRAPLPPGPRGHWLVGSLPEFGRDLLGFLADCARDHYDVVHLRLGHRPAYLLSRLELIEQVLVDKQGTFIKHSFFLLAARATAVRSRSSDQRGRALAPAARVFASAAASR